MISLIKDNYLIHKIMKESVRYFSSYRGPQSDTKQLLTFYCGPEVVQNWMYCRIRVGFTTKEEHTCGKLIRSSQAVLAQMILVCSSCLF